MGELRIIRAMSSRDVISSSTWPFCFWFGAVRYCVGRNVVVEFSLSVMLIFNIYVLSIRSIISVVAFNDIDYEYMYVTLIGTSR